MKLLISFLILFSSLQTYCADASEFCDWLSESAKGSSIGVMDANQKNNLDDLEAVVAVTAKSVSLMKESIDKKISFNDFKKKG